MVNVGSVWFFPRETYFAPYASRGGRTFLEAYHTSLEVKTSSRDVKYHDLVIIGEPALLIRSIIVLYFENIYILYIYCIYTIYIQAINILYCSLRIYDTLWGNGWKSFPKRYQNSHGLLVEENLFSAWRLENWDSQLSNDVYHGGGFVWWKWVKIAIV